MMKTEKLYYVDNCTECTAKVLDCREAEGCYEIITDRTCFFPEGGGQPADMGSINGVQITDAQEKDGIIIHIAKAEIKAGAEVNMCVDTERRADHCAQHTGEHMLSGLAKAMYGAVTC